MRFVCPECAYVCCKTYHDLVMDGTLPRRHRPDPSFHTAGLRFVAFSQAIGPRGGWSAAPPTHPPGSTGLYDSSVGGVIVGDRPDPCQ